MGIYVWGTGCGASELTEKGLDLSLITAFVDSYPSGKLFLGKEVLLPEQLPVDACDLLIISARQTDAIGKRAHELGVPEERMLYTKNTHRLKDLNRNSVANRFLSPELLDSILPKHKVLTVPQQLLRTVLPSQELENDYVRLSTLELICRRLCNIPGACAELGVYKGYFARCINLLMPERPLYLFDSFEGFSENDHASDAFQAAHRNTAAEKVLQILPHPESVRLHPGFFPQSLNGLEEKFCLVSLDVDFFDTTLEGLRYFWPRLQHGGCILLHDWGEPKLPGVKAALEKYEVEIGQKLPSVPICDLGGTLIIVK